MIKSGFATSIGFSVLSLFCLTTALSQDRQYFGLYANYAKGDTSYTYENNVTLLKTPSEDTDTLAILPIGALVIIDSTYETDYDVEWVKPNFYPIRYNGMKGYVPGHTLGIAKFSYPELQIHLIFNYPDKQDYNEQKLTYKELYGDTVIYENVIALQTPLFHLYSIGKKGLDSLEDLIVVEYIAQACGEQGGKDIYTWSPMELMPLAQLNDIGDGGVYYITEQLIFPSDPGGQAKKILFISEEETVFDEETEWKSVTTITRTYNWVGGNMAPEFQAIPEEDY